MNSFLVKLKMQKKLGIVEKSQEMCESYLLKSENCLKSAKILLKEPLYENSTIDSYYAMYNCVLALFFKCGIKCENHTGSIVILKEIFNLPQLAESLKDAKKSRIDSQYYISETKEEANQDTTEKAIKSSENFILQLKTFIGAIKTSEMEEIRKELESL
ncbi:HEPN domain-containing protein [Candidatus Woesearchaeota archaeon]|nr:HEPN domain-containing protein [Candidatus Woesearchaeota archaeon]